MQLNHINGAIKEEVPFRAVYPLAVPLNAPGAFARPDDVANRALPLGTQNLITRRLIWSEIFMAPADGMLGKIPSLAPRPESGGGTNSKEQLQAFSPFIFHRIII